MNFVHVVIALALLEFIGFGFAVGGARRRFGVAAPAMSGHPEFERYFRVHMNTLEQLIVFIPAILLFAYYVSPEWAAGLGAVYLVGRILYFNGYVKDAKKRGPGFGLSFLPTIVLLVGGLIGALSDYFQR